MSGINNKGRGSSERLKGAETDRAKCAKMDAVHDGAGDMFDRLAVPYRDEASEKKRKCRFKMRC